MNCIQLSLTLTTKSCPNLVDFWLMVTNIWKNICDQQNISYKICPATSPGPHRLTGLNEVIVLDGAQPLFTIFARNSVFPVGGGMVAKKLISGFCQCYTRRWGVIWKLKHIGRFPFSGNEQNNRHNSCGGFSLMQHITSFEKKITTFSSFLNLWQKNIGAKVFPVQYFVNTYW